LLLTGMIADMANLTDVNSWTDRLSHTKLRTFTDPDAHFWLEQNPAKVSKWAEMAREGHAIAWEIAGAGGSYTGRMLINGDIYQTEDAARKFLKEAK
jgi:hypothetical protein